MFVIVECPDAGLHLLVLPPVFFTKIFFKYSCRYHADLLCWTASWRLNLTWLQCLKCLQECLRIPALPECINFLFHQWNTLRQVLKSSKKKKIHEFEHFEEKISSNTTNQTFLQHKDKKGRTRATLKSSPSSPPPQLLLCSCSFSRDQHHEDRTQVLVHL